MKKFVHRLLVVFIIMFFITTSLGEQTWALYTDTIGLSSNHITSGIITPGIYEDPFYKVAEGDGNSIVENEDGSFEMTGNVDGFIPTPADCNIEDGYTLSVSVTTSKADDFYGMGFYFYGYANPYNSTVDGLSLQLTTEPLINSEFLFINKSYSSLAPDEDLSDDNNSILFVKEDFWKWDKVIDHTTAFSNVIRPLEREDKYDGQTLHFKIAVKEYEKDSSKIKVQVTINDYCDDNFTIITDKINPTDKRSALCLGVKSFYTEGKYFYFNNIEIGPHETFVPWRFQSDIK